MMAALLNLTNHGRSFTFGGVLALRCSCTYVNRGKRKEQSSFKLLLAEDLEVLNFILLRCNFFEVDQVWEKANKDQSHFIFCFYLEEKITEDLRLLNFKPKIIARIISKTNLGISHKLTFFFMIYLNVGYNWSEIGGIWSFSHWSETMDENRGATDPFSILSEEIKKWRMRKRPSPSQ